MVSEVHVGGTRGSGIVSSAADVLWKSVVCGMRRVGEVCEMCICLARGSVGGEGGEWMRGLGLGFTNPVRTGGMLDVCMGCGGVCGEWVGAWTRVLGVGVVVVSYLCVRFESGFSV